MLLLAGVVVACGSPHATGALGSWEDFDRHLHSSTSALERLLGDDEGAGSYRDIIAWSDGEMAWLRDNKSEPCYRDVQEAWFYTASGIGDVLRRAERDKGGNSMRMAASVLHSLPDRIQRAMSTSDEARAACAVPEGAASPSVSPSTDAGAST